MSNYLLIKNGTIFTHDKTIYNMDLLIQDNIIVEMQANIDEVENCEVIDATGLYIIPGLIDAHCDICEPGYDYKEDYESAGEAAARGGFTSITCSPNSKPVIDNKTVVEYVLSKTESDCMVTVYPYGALSKGCQGKEIAEVGEMQLAGVVALSDGDLSIQDSHLFKNIMQYCSMFDVPVITHCEDTSISYDNLVNAGAVSSMLGIEGSPKAAETTIVARNLLLAREYGVKIHISHVSTKETVEIIRVAKRNGHRVTAETSPHYFTLTEEEVLDYNTLGKVNPPLRSKEDVKEVLRGIVDGTIDIISSDHKPNTIDSKDVEYELASFGISSFETTFSIAYTKLVQSKLITLEQLVEKMAFNPAKLLTINRGKIGINTIADMVIFDPEEEYVVDSKAFKSKAKYTPYEGKTLAGKIKYTIIDGKSYQQEI